ncbi:hypothetical protein L596_010777 [Steinernema carpocapsae]|nr:hypothetical protein L596_010777 [Steinernema carpocapsae]
MFSELMGSKARRPLAPLVPAHQNRQSYPQPYRGILTQEQSQNGYRSRRPDSPTIAMPEHSQQARNGSMPKQDQSLVRKCGQSSGRFVRNSARSKTSKRDFRQAGLDRNGRPSLRQAALPALNGQNLQESFYKNVATAQSQHKSSRPVSRSASLEPRLRDQNASRATSSQTQHPGQLKSSQVALSGQNNAKESLYENMATIRRDQAKQAWQDQRTYQQGQNQSRPVLRSASMEPHLKSQEPSTQSVVFPGQNFAPLQQPFQVEYPGQLRPKQAISPDQRDSSFQKSLYENVATLRRDQARRSRHDFRPAVSPNHESNQRRPVARKESTDPQQRNQGKAQMSPCPVENSSLPRSSQKQGVPESFYESINTLQRDSTTIRSSRQMTRSQLSPEIRIAPLRPASRSTSREAKPEIALKTQSDFSSQQRQALQHQPNGSKPPESVQQSQTSPSNRSSRQVTRGQQSPGIRIAPLRPASRSTSREAKPPSTPLSSPGRTQMPSTQTRGSRSSGSINNSSKEQHVTTDLYASIDRSRVTLSNDQAVPRISPETFQGKSQKSVSSSQNASEQPRQELVHSASFDSVGMRLHKDPKLQEPVKRPTPIVNRETKPDSALQVDSNHKRPEDAKATNGILTIGTQPQKLQPATTQKTSPGLRLVNQRSLKQEEDNLRLNQRQHSKHYETDSSDVPPAVPPHGRPTNLPGVLIKPSLSQIATSPAISPRPIHRLSSEPVHDRSFSKLPSEPPDSFGMRLLHDLALPPQATKNDMPLQKSVSEWQLNGEGPAKFFPQSIMSSKLVRSKYPPTDPDSPASSRRIRFSEELNSVSIISSTSDSASTGSFDDDDDFEGVAEPPHQLLKLTEEPRASKMTKPNTLEVQKPASQENEKLKNVQIPRRTRKARETPKTDLSPTTSIVAPIVTLDEHRLRITNFDFEQ